MNLSKQKTFRALFESEKTRKEWSYTIPLDIREGFMDNPMVNSLYEDIERMKKLIFSKEELEYVNWFIDEWMSNNHLSWCVDDVVYKFKNIDEYIVFLNTYCEPCGE